MVASRGNLVLSLIIAPFVYFGWRLLIYIAERLVQTVKKFSPRNYIKNRQGCSLGLGCAVQLLHWAIWVLPFAVVSLLALIVRFGLDLPLTYVSEKAMVPIVAQIYGLSAKVAAEEEKWKLKSTALIGSIFILFGFVYQLIGTLMLTRW